MDFIIIILLMAVILLLVQAQGGVRALRLIGFGRRKIILDSCALIDGRIIELVRSGFIADELIIPRFILSELQMLADGNDAHKRERARFGLEVAAELQEYNWTRVRVEQSNFPGVSVTDDKLVKLAKKLNAALYTTDYNLNKVASVESVKVLNIHELVQTLRPVALPGEKLEVKIVQRGNNPQQGVGYLEDGTMIVVEGAAKAAGSTVKVEVDRMHQTVAGKMIFSHLQTQPNVRARTSVALPAHPTGRKTTSSKVIAHPRRKVHKKLI